MSVFICINAFKEEKVTSYENICEKLMRLELIQRLNRSVQYLQV